MGHKETSLCLRDSDEEGWRSGAQGNTYAESQRKQTHAGNTFSGRIYRT